MPWQWFLVPKVAVLKSVSGSAEKNVGRFLYRVRTLGYWQTRPDKKQLRRRFLSNLVFLPSLIRYVIFIRISQPIRYGSHHRAGLGYCDAYQYDNIISLSSSRSSKTETINQLWTLKNEIISQMEGNVTIKDCKSVWHIKFFRGNFYWICRWYAQKLRISHEGT